MGYVGIPAAAAFAAVPEYEFVWGFQRESKASAGKIGILNSGRSPLGGREPGLSPLLRQVVRRKKFRCTSDFSLIAGLDAVTIAVETGFKDAGDMIVDYGDLEAALRTVGRHLAPGTLVVIESTVTPGTTEHWARRVIEEASGLEAGRDFALAHAPERVMPGKLLRNIRELDRIVGGLDAASTERARELYAPVMTKGRIIPVDCRTAEVIKTAENALRDLQIASANQLALYCERLGIDFYQVREAIGSLKGEGVTRALLLPGAGVGGHCLTKDSYHLERGFSRFTEIPPIKNAPDSLFLLARRINDFMPRHMHFLTLSALRRRGIPPRRAQVALLGWAYLQNAADDRNTPAREFRNLLLRDGMNVRVHDPYIDDHREVPIWHDLEKAVRGADVLAIVTGHRQYKHLDLDRIKRLMRGRSPILVDGRHVLKAGEAVQKGFDYLAVGRGDLNHVSDRP